MRTALPASNSLIIRENTGNFHDFGCLGAELHAKKPCLLWGFHRNSLLNRTGNFFGGTGNFFDVTGNSIRRTGKASYRHLLERRLVRRRSKPPMNPSGSSIEKAQRDEVRVAWAKRPCERPHVTSNLLTTIFCFGRPAVMPQVRGAPLHPRRCPH